MKTKIFIIFAFIIGMAYFFAGNSCAKEEASHLPVLTMFHSPTCSDCVRIKNEVMPGIEREFKDKVAVKYLNGDETENYKLLLGLEEKYHAKVNNIFPVFFLGGKFVNGEGDVEKDLRLLLADIPADAATYNIQAQPLPKVDLVQRFKSFTPAALIAVGLIDGINPCAVTVIVFFMSFLAVRGYRKREIIVIGLLFIFSVYLTYVLIGLGIFGFLYNLQGFWLISKIINLTIGSISILFSIYALYDFIQYKRTKSTDDSILYLPKGIKAQIHKVIRMNYHAGDEAREGALKKPLFGLAMTALVTGFLVSVLEAVCVAKIYLPTIIFVLKTTNMKMQALFYLLLYNLLFVLPLFVIFLFALAGTSSERFAAILKGHLGTVKILMGLMFLCLGVFLILRA